MKRNWAAVPGGRSKNWDSELTRQEAKQEESSLMEAEIKVNSRSDWS